MQRILKKISGISKSKKDKRRSKVDSQVAAIGLVAASTSHLSGPSTPALDNVGPVAILPNARDFHLENFTYNVDNRGAVLASNSISHGWDVLLKQTAPSALYDSRAQFDKPKCDEDTRVEVTDEIMGWIQSEVPNQRLLCITGAAGAGKSAIQQTIAERCAGLGILAASFFFWTGDTTRNTVEPFVATIAYQLALASTLLRKSMVEVVEANPLIFTKSLKKQMDVLIVEPFRQNRSRLDCLPHTILVDGLDECSGQENQAELLAAIHESLLAEDLPFRILIASRPELPIHTALAINGHLHPVAYHIQLSDQYDASNDIQRYLCRRLRDIARRSGDSRARDGYWPGDDIITLLVENASGQFIYAATVIKYISEPRTSPVDRLQAIVSWSPGNAQRTKPFAALDRVYHQILSIARDNYRRIDGNEDNFLVLFRISMDIEPLCRMEVSNMPDILSLADGSFKTLISDARSLVKISVGTRWTRKKEVDLTRIDFYHKSCGDFLCDRDRAGELFVSDAEIISQFSRICFEHVERGIAFTTQQPSRELETTSMPANLRDRYESAVWCLPHTFVNMAISDGIAAIRRYIELGLWAQPRTCEKIRAHLRDMVEHLADSNEDALTNAIMTQLRRFEADAHSIYYRGARGAWKTWYPRLAKITASDTDSDTDSDVSSLRYYCLLDGPTGLPGN